MSDRNGGSGRSKRLEELSRRAARERERLTGAVESVADDVHRRRTQLKVAGMAATGIATAATVAWRLFGASSPAAQIGRAASATSILLGVGKAFLRFRRFL